MDLIQNCPVDRINELIHGVIDGECRLSQPSYVDFSKIWSLDEWWIVSDTTRNLVREFSRDNLSKDEIFNRLDGLSSNYQQLIFESLSLRKADLRRAMIEASVATSSSTLADFDWQVKLALASDKIASMHQPYVQLSLDMAVGESPNQSVSIELNRDELKKLITSLDAANKALNQLRTS